MDPLRLPPRVWRLPARHGLDAGIRQPTARPVPRAAHSQGDAGGWGRESRHLAWGLTSPLPAQRQHRDLSPSPPAASCWSSQLAGVPGGSEDSGAAGHLGSRWLPLLPLPSLPVPLLNECTMPAVPRSLSLLSLPALPASASVSPSQSLVSSLRLGLSLSLLSVVSLCMPPSHLLPLLPYCTSDITHLCAPPARVASGHSPSRCVSPCRL